MMLSIEQKNFYEQNGFLRIKNVISEDDCKKLIKESDEFSNGFYTNYLDMHKYKGFKKMHTGKTLCDIADSILEKRAIPIGSIFFFCKPNNKMENGSTWHQDNYAGKASFGSYLNLALSLDEAREDNGALMVVPGSHKLGDLDCNPKANFSIDDKGRLYNSAPIGNDCELPDMPILQLEYNRGDILLVHAHLVHKANKNKHPNKWRRTMYFVYVKEGEAFWPGFTAKRELLERYDSAQHI